MRIALISEWRYPIYGWGQIHMDYLSQILVKKYWYHVDLFTRKIRWDDGSVFDKDEINEHWVHIFRVWPLAIFFNGYMRLVCLITMTFSLFFKAKKERYDIIHAHAMLPGIPAKIVWWLTWIPVVYTVHGTMFMDAGKRNFSYYFEKFMVCILRYDLEISVSSKILQYHNRNKNIQIIYNGVDLKKIQTITVQKKYDKLTFLTVARMDWQKNHQIILDAVMVIWADFFREREIQFVRVGDGLKFDELRKMIESKGLENIIIMKWKRNYEQTIQEYRKSHLFLLPSLSEGQPLTVLESFACALPVLATDVWDNAFFIKDNQNGELFPAWKLDALVEIIQKYAMIDRENIQIMGYNGYVFVHDYSWEECMKKVVEAYLSISSKPFPKSL